MLNYKIDLNNLYNRLIHFQHMFHEHFLIWKHSWVLIESELQAELAKLRK